MKSLSEIRRAELRRAAFAVLQQQGMAGATLEKVAAQAGASKGIVLHYFRNKQEVFEHAMREANAQLMESIVLRMRQARSPQERLFAIIDGNFAEHFFQPSVCQGWLSLCAAVPHDKTLARIQRVIHARMRSNLVSALKDLVAARDIEATALGITTLIDGLWLRRSLQGERFTRREALEQMEDYVRARTGLALGLADAFPQASP